MLPQIINFDEASKAWNRNKIYLGNGTYKYISKCDAITKNGKRCKNKCLSNSNLCYIHKPK